MENELGGQFVLSWEKAKSGWNDESSAEFEKNHIDELRANFRSYINIG